jgi:hypothetical protein
MSELTVGSLSGLASNDFVIDVASGSSLDLSSGATLPAGSVLQVVSFTKTNIFSASIAAAGVSAITGLSATITPSATGSKILCILDVNATNAAGTFAESFGIILKRGATAIGIGDAEGSRVRVTSMGFAGTNTHASDNVALTFLDSPATTSATTYSVDIVNGTSVTRTLSVNQVANTSDFDRNFRASSTITLMEIAG